MKKDFVRLVVILLVPILAFAILIIGTRYEIKMDKEEYNNGICSFCGGEYRFTSAVHYRNGGDRYYYTCDECGHTIETVCLMK